MKNILSIRIRSYAESTFRLYVFPLLVAIITIPVYLLGADHYSAVPFQLIDAERINENTIRVPFRLAGRLIAVKAAVGDRQGIFILDTGANNIILNKVHFPNGWIPRQFGTAAAGTTGIIENVKKSTIDDFRWDSLYFGKLTADIIDLSHIEEKKNIEILGLIGYRILTNFEVLIDFQLRQLTLSRLDKDGERIDRYAIIEAPVDSINFRMQSHFITLDAHIDKYPVTFGLDTGAELNLMHHRIKRKILDHFEVKKRVMLNGTGSQEIEVLAGKLYRFRCGDQRLPGMNTLLTNMNEMNASYRTQLDGLLGFEFLNTRRTIINYKKKKLYFLKWHRP